MKYFESVLELVGHTPLVKLQRLVNDDMADIYVKMEHLNPTGSVKDRMAVNMVRRAEAAGLMKLLGHPHRMMILCELKQDERSVSELSDRIGIPQSPLSQHLARMRHEGVVTSRREAQTVYYSLVGEEVGAGYTRNVEPRDDHQTKGNEHVEEEDDEEKE